jgi:hypothetical protein
LERKFLGSQLVRTTSQMMLNSATQQSFQLRARRYLIDFLASAYPRYALTSVLGLVMALLMWSLLPHRQSIEAAIQGSPQHRMQPDSSAIAQRVATAHLFGQDASIASSAVSVAAANITVEGVIYSEDKDSALAILKVDDHSDIFRIGDTLPDGEKLLAIAPTAVEIGSPAAPRVLAMQQDFGDGGGPLLAGIAGPPGRDSFFPDTHAAAQPAAYVPSLRPVLLSQNGDPLSQLRSLRQQLIRQRPPDNATHPVKRPAKP